MYQKVIIEHAKKSQQNMRVAILAGLTLEKLRAELIGDFSIAMKKALENEKWENINIERWQSDPTGKFTGMWFRQNSWPENIYIKIEARDRGMCEYIYGVTIRNEHVDKPVYENKRKDIGTCLDEIKLGIRSKSWPWYQQIEAPYNCFDNEVGMLALYEKNAMIKYLIDRVEVVRTALEKHFKKCDD